MGHCQSRRKKDMQCDPPHLVMPITIEPSKPRMCHDERFLNLCMNTPNISFNHITDISRYVVGFNNFQAKLEDKSGYDHIALTEDSRIYFGLYWKGWFLIYNLLDGVLVPVSITQRAWDLPVIFDHAVLPFPSISMTGILANLDCRNVTRLNGLTLTLQMLLFSYLL